MSTPVKKTKKKRTSIPLPEQSYNTTTTVRKKKTLLRSVEKTTKHNPSAWSSFGVQLGHFLKVNPDALAVEQNKVNVFQGGRTGRHKMVGDGFQNELGCRLLGESVPVGRGRCFSMKV